jgi:hypothetical protein
VNPSRRRRGEKRGASGLIVGAAGHIVRARPAHNGRVAAGCATMVASLLVFTLSRRLVMLRRTRKFIGAVAMLVFVCVYALVAMAVAQGAIQDAGKLAQAAFYVVVGLGWILPIMPLIRWMERPDSEDA